ncbi:hypothetical protein [Catenulispora subtropica]|uniref:FAD-binding PCMH-type domain-containing protein n=1 Tax=Catenulispora subtropica TaxID=450798 RepID=A0ABN2RZM3_9ACTN
MSAVVSELVLAGADEAEDLGGYLTRLLRFDKAAAVRVVATGTAVGVYGQPPFDVLTLRTLALAPAGSAAARAGVGTAGADTTTTLVETVSEVDVTVSAGDLLHAIAPDGALPLPRPLAGATAWTGFLPPRAGWQPVGGLPVAEVEAAALAGIAAFKERAEAIPDRERTRAAVDRVAAEIWDRSLAYGLPVRAAHAARAMAFLGPAQSATATVRSAGRWLRLDAPYGTVVLRTGSGLLP